MKFRLPYGVQFLAGFMRRYQRDYIIGLIFTISSALASSTMPIVIKEVINSLERGTDTRSVLIAGLGIALLGAAKSILFYLGRNRITVTGRRVESDLRDKLFERLLITRTEILEREGSGRISSKITNDLEHVRTMLGFGGIIISYILPVFMFSLIMEILISPVLTLIVFIPLALIPPTVILYERKIFRQSELIQEKISEISEFSYEAFSRIKLIKNYTIEDEICRKFSNLLTGYATSNLQLSRQRAGFEALIVALSLISLMVAIFAGYIMESSGLITKGDLAAFVAYQIAMIWPTMAIGYMFVVLQRGLACVLRIAELFAQPRDFGDLLEYGIPAEKTK